MNRDNDNEQPTVTVKSKFKAQRILYVAPSGMGKTFLLCQRVLQYIKEKRYEPKHIIIFASNHLTDKSLEPLIKRCSKAVKDFQETHCFKEINVSLINALYQSQNFIMEKQRREAPHYLLILDDQLTSPDLFSPKSPIRDVMIQGRHRNISIIINQQKLKMASVGSSLIRENCSEINIGSLSSQGLVEGIAEDYSGGLADNRKDARKLFVKMYQDAVASCKGKGFITIRPEVMLGEGRFTRSCDGLSYDKQEITSFIEPTFIDTTVTKTKPSRKTKKKDLKEEEITQ